MSTKNLFHPYPETKSSPRTRRYLPHWVHPQATYFVTFRTADSLPESRLREYRHEREVFLRRHKWPWSVETKRLYHRMFEGRIEKWLDLNHGSCPFRDPEKAKILADSLRYFDQSRYILDDFAVMPNHVHVLVKPLGSFDLGQILHSWKSYSSLRINRLAKRAGRFWMDESFDHIVRSWRRLEAFRSYIRGNPLKARLTKGQYLVGRGSGLIPPA